MSHEVCGLNTARTAVDAGSATTMRQHIGILDRACVQHSALQKWLEQRTANQQVVLYTSRV